MEAQTIQVLGRALTANSLCSTGRNARPERQILEGTKWLLSNVQNSRCWYFAGRITSTPPRYFRHQLNPLSSNDLTDLRKSRIFLRLRRWSAASLGLALRRMTITRFPSLAHWGAFSALVENGRVIKCEPFGRDAAPSPMLAAIPEMVHSPLRISRPSIREGWREGRPRSGADRFREVDWDEALDLVAGELTRVRSEFGDTAIFGGSYGWSSAGRVHHARTLVRRFLFQGGGCVDQ